VSSEKFSRIVSSKGLVYGATIVLAFG